MLQDTLVFPGQLQRRGRLFVIWNDRKVRREYLAALGTIVGSD